MDVGSWLDLCTCVGVCAVLGSRGGGGGMFCGGVLCVCRDLKTKQIKPVSGKRPWPVSCHVMSTL